MMNLKRELKVFLCKHEEVNAQYSDESQKRIESFFFLAQPLPVLTRRWISKENWKFSRSFTKNLTSSFRWISKENWKEENASSTIFLANVNWMNLKRELKVSWAEKRGLAILLKDESQKRIERSYWKLSLKSDYFVDESQKRIERAAVKMALLPCKLLRWISKENWKAFIPFSFRKSSQPKMNLKRELKVPSFKSLAKSGLFGWISKENWKSSNGNNFIASVDIDESQKRIER